MTPKENKERLLVLCVDRDGDLGVKAERKTPIFGRKENLDAAVSLALKDPEEADSNAMFEAIRLFDQLRKHGQPHEKFQIVTISGLQLLGVEADRKLVRELNEALKIFPANSVILVTDGYSDEAVLPLVESRVPVTSVRRIIVKHSKSIEETAALFGKYLKALLDNPRYSRIALGVPGLLLIVLVAMYLGAGALWLYYTWIAFLIVLGITFLVKGFGFDKAAVGLLRWIREYEPPPFQVQIAGFALAAGVIASAVGTFLGVTEAASHYSSLNIPSPTVGEWVSLLPRFIGEFIEQGIYLIVIGICTVLSGRAIRSYFERSRSRLLRTLVITVVIAWSSQIFLQVSIILINPVADEAELIFTIFIGILLAIASSLVALIINVKYGGFSKKEEKKVEGFSG